jgi:hypothetical protein
MYTITKFRQGHGAVYRSNAGFWSFAGNAMCEVERDALLVIAWELRTLRGPLSALMFSFAMEIFLP